MWNNPTEGVVTTGYFDAFRNLKTRDKEIGTITIPQNMFDTFPELEVSINGKSIIFSTPASLKVTNGSTVIITPYKEPTHKVEVMNTEANPVPVETTSTVDVNIESQSNPINTKITGQDGNIDINIDSQSVPLEVNIASQSGPVEVKTPAGTPLDVNVDNTVTVEHNGAIDTNIVGQDITLNATIPVSDPIPVNVQNDVNIMSSGTLDVSIEGQSAPIEIRTPAGESVDVWVSNTPSVAVTNEVEVKNYEEAPLYTRNVS